jgi:hypothetical protein
MATAISPQMNQWPTIYRDCIWVMQCHQLDCERATCDVRLGRAMRMRLESVMKGVKTFSNISFVLHAFC